MTDHAGEADRPDLGHLPRPDAALGALFRVPRHMGLVALALLVLAGWLCLGLMVALHARTGQAGALGPGMAIFDLLAVPGGLDALGRALWDTLCAPAAAPATPAGFAVLVLMWSAMVLAMMLPTAGPMILTYAEIADTAAGKSEPIVSPLVLAAGYLLVWLGASLAFALAQTGLVWSGLIADTMAPAAPALAGILFLIAGFWQFSATKHACVTQCQRPMPYFFSHWTEKRSGVFRLGLDQGLFCLGCCWAMMLVMFAVGTMNVVWMAVLGVLMTLEKLSTGLRFTRGLGFVFAGIGAALILLSLARLLPA
jgi:predicted metal-binding membrane protein